MTDVKAKKDRVTQFIDAMQLALSEEAATGANPPFARRKLRTVTAECKKRASEAFLKTLGQRLQLAGIYTEPPLGDFSTRIDDWIWFSTGPFPPDAAFFPKEKDLQRFVEACVGNGTFRGLEPFRVQGRASGLEFPLPDGRRIDLLCQERTRRGTGALVAIEFKRSHERGTVEQMAGYIDALKQMYPDREVRGIIISGREDRVAASLLKGVTGYKIDWLCYHVKFEPVSFKD